MDSVSYNKEIERMNKHQLYGKIVLVLLVQLNGETQQGIVSMNRAIYLLFQFSIFSSSYFLQTK